ncbi:hypothetical protein H6F98_00465 [Microcoleus sp. FACHB-SPT15]|uniref:hypothetical protein n=1 Tax=Microcoleus sp. FACHB-SPT15 TaxID=2692830 RepID=UPI0017826707|nr:hypothetical protein [Microcoleus sp. FACHB-SPT15]MBD1803951.1 hypothetical protein [Microcoleus sp. FACHB-SPT15]
MLALLKLRKAELIGVVWAYRLVSLLYYNLDGTDLRKFITPIALCVRGLGKVFCLLVEN